MTTVPAPPPFRSLHLLACCLILTTGFGLGLELQCASHLGTGGPYAPASRCTGSSAACRRGTVSRQSRRSAWRLGLVSCSPLRLFLPPQPQGRARVGLRLSRRDPPVHRRGRCGAAVPRPPPHLLLGRGCEGSLCCPAPGPRGSAAELCPLEGLGSGLLTVLRVGGRRQQAQCPPSPSSSSRPQRGTCVILTVGAVAGSAAHARQRRPRRPQRSLTQRATKGRAAVGGGRVGSADLPLLYTCRLLPCEEARIAVVCGAADKRSTPAGRLSDPSAQKCQRLGLGVGARPHPAVVLVAPLCPSSSPHGRESTHSPLLIMDWDAPGE